MILHYACGGGLGHLTRARAVARALELEKETLLVASSAYAEDARVVDGIDCVRVPEKLDQDVAGAGRWLRELINDIRPTAITIDTFPAGLFGELSDAIDPSGPPVTLIARDLKWGLYRQDVDRLPRIENVLAVETLSEEYHDALRQHAGVVRALTLAPPMVAPRHDAAGAWLIVHSGPDDEIMQLVSFANDLASLEGIRPDILLIAPRRPAALPDTIRWIDAYPAAAFFAAAERIITAAGFNTMLETEPFKERHHVHPFPRRFDDQFRRAARRNALPCRPAPGEPWDA